MQKNSAILSGPSWSLLVLLESGPCQVALETVPRFCVSEKASPVVDCCYFSHPRFVLTSLKYGLPLVLSNVDH